MAQSDRTTGSVHVDAVSVSYDGAVDAVHDVTLDVAPGSIVALLGPSGCGKTSLLRALAGLERPTAGTVRIGDREVSGPKTWVRPEHRNVGMVFQDGALFPHLSVADNIAFGLRAASSSIPRREHRSRVAELLDLVDLAGLGDRLPDTLSGGQQQRVALARSLAPSPSVLLLDEPFSALDAGLRVHVRVEVARILREVGVTAIFVTHDQDEAFVLGDRVAVMREGRIEQIGTPDELYRSPVSRWVARFVGEANFVAATPGESPGSLATAIGTVGVSGSGMANRGDVLVRPEQIDLAVGDHAEIVSVEYYGHDVRYEVRLDDGTVLAARALPDVLRRRGDRVAIRVDGTSSAIFTD